MAKTHVAIASLLALSAASQAVMVWTVGLDDNGWPVGDGGGPNATFVQESGINALPGNPANPEVNAQSDDDYYFAGLYTTQVDGGPVYATLGAVAANEEGAERAFAGTDNSLRYHFNLPATVSPTDLLTVTFDANNLDTRAVEAPNPHYGVEVYFNNTLVLAEVDVNPGTIDFDFTSPAFTLASVNAQIGAGFDNYVELRGINYSATGGGSWMGVDYVQLDATPIPEPRSSVMILLGSVLFLNFLRRRIRS